MCMLHSELTELIDCMSEIHTHIDMIKSFILRYLLNILQHSSQVSDVDAVLMESLC